MNRSANRARSRMSSPWRRRWPARLARPWPLRMEAMSPPNVPPPFPVVMTARISDAVPLMPDQAEVGVEANGVEPNAVEANEESVVAEQAVDREALRAAL